MPQRPLTHFRPPPTLLVRKLAVLLIPSRESSNIARMLRPGGYFVANYKVSPVAPLEPSPSVMTAVFFDQQGNGDTLYCYRRQ